AALDKARASDFVQQLPNKYDQILGTDYEDGELPSGGQWQKLELGRAPYQDAPVLIMDEPTSAIDAEAELEIFDNLAAEYRNKTLILVSHRLSTVRKADRLIVIEGGRVVESGTHETLLDSAAGRYRSMFTAQAAAYR